MPVSRVFVALDEMRQEEVCAFLKRSGRHFDRVKVGLELWNTYGAELVRRLAGDFGVKVFLDLKLHDIPNTVAKAVRGLRGLPVDFLTVHLSGGRQMLRASLSEAQDSLPGCQILGVSVLTSLGPQDMAEIWGEGPREEVFARLFDLGLSSEVPGMVLSAQELEILKARQERAGRPCLRVCPGIRFADEIATGALQDQKRVVNPQRAVELGADFLVIGRSITRLDDHGLRTRAQELSNLWTSLPKAHTNFKS